MRRPRMRITVRRLLIVVAALAIVLGAERTFRRWRLYRERTAWYAGFEARWSDNSEGLRTAADDLAAGCRPMLPFWARWDNATGLRGEPHADLAEQGRYLREEAALYEAWAAHCARMRRKWEDAAGRPWVAVEADPPLPWYANDLHVRRFEEVGGAWPPTPTWRPTLPP